LRFGLAEPLPLLVGRGPARPLPAEVPPREQDAEPVGAQRDPPLLGQPPRQLGQRPGAGAAGRVLVQPRLQGQEVLLAQPGRAAGAGAVGQAGEARGPEARDRLADRLGVEPEGAGGLGDRRPVGDGPDHPQPVVDPTLGRAGAQAALQLGALGGIEVDAQRRLHGGASFRVRPHDTADFHGPA
jgi:hypothetical protein